MDFRILPPRPPRYFCIILNLLRSHQADLFGLGGGGGGGKGGCVQLCNIDDNDNVVS